MTAFLFLVLLHLIYDVHLQTGFIAQYKGQKPFVMAMHAGTWALLIWFGLMYTGIAAPWYKLVFLFTSHFLTDTWKTTLPKDDAHFWGIYVDQALHYAALALVVL